MGRARTVGVRWASKTSGTTILVKMDRKTHSQTEREREGERERDKETVRERGRYGKGGGGGDVDRDRDRQRGRGRDEEEGRRERQTDRKRQRDRQKVTERERKPSFIDSEQKNLLRLVNSFKDRLMCARISDWIEWITSVRLRELVISLVTYWACFISSKTYHIIWQRDKEGTTFQNSIALPIYCTCIIQ